MAGGANYGLDKAYLSAAAIGSAATGPDLVTSYDYFLFVKISGTAGTTVTPAAAGDVVLGVAQQRVVTADINKQPVDVRMYGISKVVAGGTLAFGDKVKSDAAGKAVVNAVGTLANTAGIVVGAGGASGDLVDVLLTPGGRDAAS